MTVRVYGITNCDSVRKARAWLDAAGIAHEFHDYRKAGIDAATLRGWVDRLGWDRVLNRAGTTFRNLPDDQRRDLDAERSVALMQTHPTTIKRPILMTGNVIEAGFKPERYAAIFAKT